VRHYRGRPVGMPGEESGEARAARRDASWYRKPGRSWKSHIVAEDGASACRGFPLILESTSTPPRDATVPAASVQEESRCRANGCAQRWP
jgi:hypothetical protein